MKPKPASHRSASTCSMFGSENRGWLHTSGPYSWTGVPGCRVHLGQTSCTQGTASILVDIQGSFTWERRTGKTIYISIRREEGTVASNRLILRVT